MIVVIDTSAALRIILNHKQSSEMLDILDSADWVIAPRLYISEVTNTFWKYFHLSSLSKDVCEQGIEKALHLVEDFFNEDDLYREAFAMGCLTKHSVYDMMYAVLARRNDALLLTADEKLKKVCAKFSIQVKS